MHVTNLYARSQERLLRGSVRFCVLFWCCANQLFVLAQGLQRSLQLHAHRRGGGKRGGRAASPISIQLLQKETGCPKQPLASHVDARLLSEVTSLVSMCHELYVSVSCVYLYLCLLFHFLAVHTCTHTLSFTPISSFLLFPRI